MTQISVTDPLPLITIGMTCYNAADTILRALNSAVSQDWQNLEIIVVDDVSQDESVAVIQGFIDGLGPNQPPVRLIQHKINSGPAAARNSLLQAAKGAFLAFFDDDDESFPNRIRKQYERITSYESETGAALVACYISGTRLYPNGYSLDLKAIGARPPIPHGEALAQRALFYGGPKHWHYGGTPTCSMMIRTCVLRNIGGFDEHLRRVEDIDIAVRLALADAHFIGCPEKLFIQHATWGADKDADKNLDGELRIVEKHRKYLEGLGMYEYARDWPKIRHAHFRKNYAAMALMLARLWIRHPYNVTRHLLSTGPARLLHERRMKKPSENKDLVLATIALNNMAGGLEKNIINLANAMAKRGHNVHVITFDQPGARPFYPLADIVQWHMTGTSQPHEKISFLSRLRLISNIRKILGQFGPKTPIVCFHHGILARFFIAGLFLKHRIMCAERSSVSLYEHTGRSRSNVNFQLLRLCHKVIVQFPRYIQNYPAYLRKKMCSIGNPVFAPVMRAAPDQPTPGARWNIICIGRLGYPKNIDVLIEAFAHSAQQFPNWDLQIIGDGPNYKELQHLIATKNLQSRVFIHGKQTEVAPFLCQSHVFCMPSLWEGFPNALAEALAHGLPCVGFENCDGVRDLIKPGENGFLASGRDNPQMLAEVLEKLMQDAPLRQRLGKHATTIASLYNPQDIYNQWESLIKNAVS